MKLEDPHTLSFNISSSSGSTTGILILFPQESEVWALHFEDYVLGLEGHATFIWDAIMKETITHTTTRKLIITQVEYSELLPIVKEVAHDEKNKL